MKDYVRASMSWFCFFSRHCTNYIDLFNNLIYLTKARKHLEEYLENNIQWSTVSGQSPNSKQQTEICNLFRPPYGKIKMAQSKRLRQLGYKIIMWDVLSADFDTRISPEKCLENVLKNVKSGSIIVFHDSIKAFPNLEYTLPKALQYWAAKGFVCDAIK